MDEVEAVSGVIKVLAMSDEIEPETFASKASRSQG